MRCRWCHNPESQAFRPELLLRGDRCISCGDCLKACRYGAVIEVSGSLVNLRENCRRCFDCVQVCPSEARAVVGRKVTADEVMEEVERDRGFYEESGGGVTFSGGEPLMQPTFLNGLLERCRAREIHTAVETAGYAKREDLLKAGAKADLILYDLKLMDDKMHQAYTGVSNRVILENLWILSRSHPHVIVRFPIIPGVNDSDEHLSQLSAFLSGLEGVREVHLLPYHKAGTEKYARLGKPYDLPAIEPPTEETMNRIAEKLSAFGKEIVIGG